MIACDSDIGNTQTGLCRLWWDLTRAGQFLQRLSFSILWNPSWATAWCTFLIENTVCWHRRRYF